MSVASLRMRFGECYTRGARAAPGVEGRVKLWLNVGAQGRVETMSHTTEGNLTPWMIECVRWVAGGAQFQAPSGGKAQLVVPVTFARPTDAPPEG